MLYVFAGYKFDAIKHEGKAMFKGASVCRFLEMPNPSRSIKAKCRAWHYQEISLGEGRPAIYLTLGGVIRLAMQSDKDDERIQEFQDWVTDDVVPSVLIDGAYISDSASLTQLTKIQSDLDTYKTKALEAYQAVSQYQSELEFAKSQVVSIQQINVDLIERTQAIDKEYKTYRDACFEMSSDAVALQEKIEAYAEYKEKAEQFDELFADYKKLEEKYDKLQHRFFSVKSLLSEISDI